MCWVFRPLSRESLKECQEANRESQCCFKAGNTEGYKRQTVPFLGHDDGFLRSRCFSVGGSPRKVSNCYPLRVSESQVQTSDLSIQQIWLFVCTWKLTLCQAKSEHESIHTATDGPTPSVAPFERCYFVICLNTRGLYTNAGFVVSKVTSSLTLSFPGCDDGGALLTGYIIMVFYAAHLTCFGYVSDYRSTLEKHHILANQFSWKVELSPRSHGDWNVVRQINPQSTGKPGQTGYVEAASSYRPQDCHHKSIH